MLTALLLVALWVAPKPTLHVFWDMVIPLLPAVFLINPLIWRNVCPLATLNDIPGRRQGRQPLSQRSTRVAWIVGIALLFVLVPARRFLFNSNGQALSITILLVGLMALGAGLRFARRSGFCSSICPVLPVEKLYGQSPLLRIDGARCDSCTLCTAVGCIDLASTKTVAQTIGPRRRDARWVRTSFGAFSAAFPGFVLGYFGTSNGSPAVATGVYAHVFWLAVLSYAVVAITVTVLQLRASIALPLLGAAALALYYWSAAPSLLAAYGAPSEAVRWLRLAVLATVGFWLWTTWSGSTGTSERSI